MKYFLLKIVIIIIPVFIFLFFIEYKVRENDRSTTYYQKKYILENKEDIEGVFFGSSHSHRGIFPKHLDYNVAIMARSMSAINIDSYLYDYVSNLVAPKFYVFDLSQGYLNVSRGNEYLKSNHLHYYFPIKNNRELKENFLMKLPLKNHIVSKTEETICDKWGFELKISKREDLFRKLKYNDSLLFTSDRSKRVIARESQDINESVYNENALQFKRIIDDCKKKNIKVIFISPPKYHLYNKRLRKEFFSQRELFLKDVVDNKTVFFFNFENFKENESKLFFDLNHLNIEGAKTFTKEFNKKLKTIL